MRSPSLFCYFEIEDFVLFKISGFCWYRQFLFFRVEFTQNKRNSWIVKIFKITKIQLVICDKLPSQGHETWIRWIKVLILANLSRGRLFGKFDHHQEISCAWNDYSKSYDVPLWCFLKARKWDIETLETALESSEPVFHGGGGSNSNEWTLLANLPFQKFTCRTPFGYSCPDSDIDEWLRQENRNVRTI